MKKVIIHHLEYSRSQRIIWLLEEIGVEYEIKVYKRDPKTIRAPKSLRKIHPLGRAPLVTLGDEVLAESGAIIENLIEHFEEAAPLRPSADDMRSYRFWMHYAEGSVMTPLIVHLITSRLKIAPMPFFIRPIAKGIADKINNNYTNAEIKNHFDFIEEHLGKNEYFLGDTFSAADLQMSYPIEMVQNNEVVGSRPNMSAWLARVSERPAYKKAQEKGGPTALPS